MRSTASCVFLRIEPASRASSLATVLLKIPSLARPQFIAGSAIHALNGVYGPRLQEHEIESRLPPEIAKDIAVGAYLHDSSGWILANVKNPSGATEWVFFDPSKTERFAHLGNTLIPGSGKRWWHLHRSSRVPPSAADAAGSSASTGPASESTQVRASGVGDDDDELPWQVIGIRDDHRLNELRMRSRQHSTETSAAAARRAAIGAPAPPSSASETAPPDGLLSSDVFLTAAADGERLRDAGELAEAASLYVHAAQHTSWGSYTGGWGAAVLYYRAACALRRVRDFDGAQAAIAKALAHYPRYLAALWEHALIRLDEGKPSDAIGRLQALHTWDRDWPGLSGMIVLAHAAQRRQERGPPPPPQKPPRPPPPNGCEAVWIGAHEPPAEVEPVAWSKVKEAAVSIPDARCPEMVDKANWLFDGPDYDDRFSVAQEGGTLTVTRADQRAGWGMDLRILCCNAAGEAALAKQAADDAAPAEHALDEATRARLDSPNHYALLQVAVDFTAAELKKAYRALSLRLHPDRAGGSTELFARAAKAHDCLTDDGCRVPFDEGHDVEGYQPNLKEAVERHYYPEKFPFEPFGPIFNEHDDGPGAKERGERLQKRQREAAGWMEANSSFVEKAMPAPDVTHDEVDRVKEEL